MDYSTTELITNLKERAAIPTNQPAFSDTRLLYILNDVQNTWIMPFLVESNDEFFVKYNDYTISSNYDSYLLPRRCYAGKVRSIEIWKSGTYVGELPLLNLSFRNVQSDVTGYYIMGSSIIINKPSTLDGYVMRVYYINTPGNLVATTEVGVVASVTNTTTIVLTSKPSTFTGTFYIDITKNYPNFETLTIRNASTVSTLTITTSSAVNYVESGDYVSITGETAICQLPYILHPLLIQGAVVKVNEILGDNESVANSKAIFDEMKLNIANVLSPRVMSQPKKIININSFI